MRFGKHHPKNKKEDLYDKVRQDQFQLYNDVCAQPHHFVGGCEDRRDGGQCHMTKKIWTKSEIHPSNRIEQF
jgi:hypothetical protein